MVSHHMNFLYQKGSRVHVNFYILFFVGFVYKKNTLIQYTYKDLNTRSIPIKVNPFFFAQVA